MLFVSKTEEDDRKISPLLFDFAANFLVVAPLSLIIGGRIYTLYEYLSKGQTNSHRFLFSDSLLLSLGKLLNLS